MVRRTLRRGEAHSKPNCIVTVTFSMSYQGVEASFAAASGGAHMTAGISSSWQTAFAGDEASAVDQKYSGREAGFGVSYLLLSTPMCRYDPDHQ